MGDVNTLGVELRVPMPTPGDFTAGKRMFISWGYNHYPVEFGSACDSLPIAYRLAKHYKTYSDSPKPPGWLTGDSTHFDPLRSYDGWGRFDLSSGAPVTGSKCRMPLADTTWDLDVWFNSCMSLPTGLQPMRPFRTMGPPAGTDAAPQEASGRDLRGRLAPRGSSRLFILPGAAPLPPFHFK
jgi:hypothetical protein